MSSGNNNRYQSFASYKKNRSNLIEQLQQQQQQQQQFASIKPSLNYPSQSKYASGNINDLQIQSQLIDDKNQANQYLSKNSRYQQLTTKSYADQHQSEMMTTNSLVSKKPVKQQQQQQQQQQSQQILASSIRSSQESIQQILGKIDAHLDMKQLSQTIQAKQTNAQPNQQYQTKYNDDGLLKQTSQIVSVSASSAQQMLNEDIKSQMQKIKKLKQELQKNQSSNKKKTEKMPSSTLDLDNVMIKTETYNYNLKRTESSSQNSNSNQNQNENSNKEVKQYIKDITEEQSNQYSLYLESKNENLNNELAQAREQYFQVSKREKQDRSLIAQLQEELGQKTEMVNSLEQMLNNLKQDQDALLRGNEEAYLSLTQQLQAKDAQINQLAQQIQAQKEKEDLINIAELKQLNERYAELVLKETRSVEQACALQSQNSNLKEQLEEAKGKLISAEDKFNKEIQCQSEKNNVQLEAISKQNEQRLAMHIDHVAKLQIRIEDLMSSSTAKESQQQQQLLEQLQQKAEKEKQLEAKMQELETQQQQRREELSLKSKCLSEANQMIARLEQEVRDLESLPNTLEIEKDAKQRLTEQNGALEHSRNIELMQVNEKIKQLVKKLEADNLALINSNQELLVQIKENQVVMEASKQSNNKLQLEIEENQQANSKCKQLAIECERTNSLYKNSQKELQIVIEQNKEKETSFNQQIQHLSSQLKASQTQVSQLESKVPAVDKKVVVEQIKTKFPCHCGSDKELIKQLQELQKLISSSYC